MGRAPLLLLAAALAVLAPANGSLVFAKERVERGFTTAVSERLMQTYARRFGPEAPARLRAWRRYAAQHEDTAVAERELLVDVNRTLNRIRFIDDAIHWGVEDYWATPAESVASNGGDCEDFAIAKLRMTYVKALKLNQAHMVLAYYPRPDAEPLVLDNLEDAVRPASQRPDLIPVYSFNDEEVWIETRGRSGSPRQIRNWNALIERLEREMRT